MCKNIVYKMHYDEYNLENDNIILNSRDVHTQKQDVFYHFSSPLS